MSLLHVKLDGFSDRFWQGDGTWQLLVGMITCGVIFHSVKLEKIAELVAKVHGRQLVYPVEHISLAVDIKSRAKSLDVKIKDNTFGAVSRSVWGPVSYNYQDHEKTLLKMYFFRKIKTICLLILLSIFISKLLRPTCHLKNSSKTSFKWRWDMSPELEINSLVC